MAKRSAHAYNPSDISPNNDRYAHPECFPWPDDAPITVYEFRAMRRTNLRYPPSSDEWNADYVLAHYPLSTIQWAAAHNRELRRLPCLWKHRVDRKIARQRDYLDVLEQIAVEMQHNPQALKEYQDRIWEAETRWRDSRRSPWRRLWWSLLIGAFTEWFFYTIVASQSSPPAHPVPYDPIAVHSALIVIAVFGLGIPALYFWRSAEWDWDDSDWSWGLWMIALVFGLPSGAIMWFIMFHSVWRPATADRLAWEAAIAFGGMVTLWMRRHYDVEWGEYGMVLAMALILVPIVMFLAF